MSEEFEKWKKRWQRTQDSGYTQQDIWDSAMAAEREAIAQYIVDQGTIQTKDGASVCYIDFEDIEMIRKRGEVER